MDQKVEEAESHKNLLCCLYDKFMYGDIFTQKHISLSFNWNKWPLLWMSTFKLIATKLGR